MKKAQQHEFYKALLKIVCSDPSTDWGLCFYITKSEQLRSIKRVYAYCDADFKKQLPVLWKLKPKSASKKTGYWFKCDAEGWQKRINLVLEAIEQTKPVK